MTISSPSRLCARFNTVARVASLFTVLVSLLVLLGWLLNVTVLKSVLPTLVTMKFNTAVAFLLSGIALWLLNRAIHPMGDRLAQTCAVLVALTGGLTLSQYLFGWNLGIDQLVFKEPLTAVGTSHPGRMAPTTALNFLLLGTSLLAVKRPRGVPVAQGCSLLVALFGLLNGVGYLYRVEALYGVASYTQMAVHTVVTFLVLSAGVLCLHPDRGVMVILTDATMGGSLARRLLPWAIGFPILLGWVRLEGERAGLYGTEFGISCFVVVVVVLFSSLIWWHVTMLCRVEEHRQSAESALSRVHQELEQQIQRRTQELTKSNEALQEEIAQRHRMEAELRQSQQDLQDFVEHASIGLHWVGPDGMILWANHAELEFLGYSTEEYVGHHIAEFHADQQVIEDILQRLASNEELRDYEARLRHKDGSIRHALISSNVLWRGRQFIHTRCFTRDITDRKRAEQARQLQFDELKQYKAITVNREIEMIRLKEEVNALLVKLGQPQHYEIRR